ncbi:hypothetical protein T484DRAFT_1812747 [Baffinella frigidus]|nr:hypothetical protein T484DRAFT_1812747 [Cryptophyta sp. CCMP2293]
MGGLALPDVVRELLKDPLVLIWDPRDNVYEVLDGDLFELRFNELRKMRHNVKAAGERPFSRMNNFFVLEREHGDKWACTGTKFRPRNVAGHPNSELSSIKAIKALAAAHVCETCGKTFVTPSKLARHMLTHSERPHVCETCGKGVLTSGYLAGHMRKHSVEKPYECKTCGKSFSQGGVLTRHMRTHSGKGEGKGESKGSPFPARKKRW